MDEWVAGIDNNGTSDGYWVGEWLGSEWAREAMSVRIMSEALNE